MITSYAQTDGETCSVVIPVRADIQDDDEIDAQAASVLQKMCQELGMSATDIHRTSAEPWTEPFGGLDPRPDFIMYKYEAIPHL